ncbi:MAG: hypothetical protein NT062_13910, partial [Proteobacteria bacterium]|nr:hypothetical protein [Pseudomonadota bacterium]
MRTEGLRSWLAIVVGASLALAGCKDKSDASTTPDPAVLKAQQELRERRDALVKAREKLQDERNKVDDEMKKVAAGGGDTSELAKQRAELDIKLETQSSELISQLSSRVESIAAGGGDKSTAIAAREAGVGSRERDFATREQRMAERERMMAERERALGEREKTMCAGGTTTIVQQAAPPLPKDANIGRTDVVNMLNRAHAGISKKGLISSDLGSAENLEGEANKAVNDGNWSKAYFAAQQLALAVDAIKIDRNFINAKVNRLQARLGQAVSASQADGMKEVLQKYGDGDFVAANR